MLLEGHIETTNFKVFFIFLSPFGLDTAEERCLLDQRIAFETNGQVTK